MNSFSHFNLINPDQLEIWFPFSLGNIPEEALENPMQEVIPHFPSQTSVTATKGTFMQQLEQLSDSGAPSLNSSTNGKSSDQYSEISPLLWLLRMTNHMQQAEDQAALFQTIASEVHQYLQADRVLIYRFQTENHGKVMAESMTSGYTPSLGKILPAIAFGAERSLDYQQQPFVQLNDIAQASLSPYENQLFAQFQVQASLSLPILLGPVWGLLVVQQCDHPRTWQDHEITLLYQITTELKLRLQPLEFRTQRQQQAQQEPILAKIIERITPSSERDIALGNITEELRRFYQADRVIFYRFRPDWSGEFIAEAVADNWKSLSQAQQEETGLTSRDLVADERCNMVQIGSLNTTEFTDTYLKDTQGGYFRVRQVQRIDDIYEAGFSKCYLSTLEKFQVRAYMIAPIFEGEQLWGLLAVHQNSGPRYWQDPEVTLLSLMSSRLDTILKELDVTAQLQKQSAQLQTQSDQFMNFMNQSKAYGSLINKIGAALIRENFSRDDMFRLVVREIRNFLNADRVAVFKFEPGYKNGAVIIEERQPGQVSALEIEVIDHCFSERMAEEYRKGRVWAVADIYQAGLAKCYIDVLAQFEVRGNLVVPLLKGEELWGLFCIHQCTGPREWQEEEIEFIKQVASQLNVAIQQAESTEQLRQQSEELIAAAEREKAAKEQLQQEVIQLLLTVRPALQGDLTVRAPITDTEVGTIADAYNNTLGSLRQLVTQMQDTSRQVAQVSADSNASIGELTFQAQYQFQTLRQTLEQVQMMISSTEAVGASAQQVELAVQQANTIILAGDAAMNRTVDSIVDIRETVVETNQRLQRLSASSQKISRVINLISNFTTQTQLLALNASIEATRAGEYGRGFVVVADEVRSLARQSADAATEIEQLVQEIQASTAGVSTAMETGIQQVASGTELVSNARENLNAIVDATSQISQLVASITLAAQGQTEQFQSLSQTMTEVATIADQTSADSTKISTSFSELLETAQQLQVSADQFKVN
ncbi:MAG: GAF domain-containing protein [Cyanothece sp. SIO1E1]|nr:GAF domain-containing protein [Cyanothece sp. SIO1E1]